MEYRNLGRSGLQVSVVGLGCNNFGWRSDLEGARAVVNRALEMGITFLDTADVYGGQGRSEEMLGDILRGQRHNVVLATKFAGKMGEGPMMRGASRAHIVQAAEDSLRRLRTDYIDLYQVHQPDPSTPIDETLRALDDLVRQGKVRYIGSSNFTAWQAVEAHFVAERAGGTPFISAQNPYSLLDRRVERELVPACTKYGVGIIPYSPLASGFLSGKYRKGEPLPEGTRLGSAAPIAQRLLTDNNFETLGRLDDFATAHGHGILDLAVGWLASQPQVGSIIAGATSPEQVEQNVRAGEWALSPEELAEVDAITRG